MSQVEVKKSTQTTEGLRLRTLVGQNSEKAERFTEDYAGLVREENSFIPKSSEKAIRIPVFMIVILLVQVCVFYLYGDFIWLYLSYDPYRRHEVWRFLTVMFAHLSESHIWANLIWQLLFGRYLEAEHHWKPVAIIYTSGVLGGTMFNTILSPHKHITGSSAGGYALIFAHVATILMNWNEMDNKYGRVFWLLVYSVVDVLITLFNEMFGNDDTLKVSHAGHFGGVLTGFLISIIVLKNVVENPWKKTFKKLCASILKTLALIIVFTNIAYPSLYLDSEFNTDYEKTFVLTYFKMIDRTSKPNSVSPLLVECLEINKCAKAWVEYKNTGKVNNAYADFIHTF